MISRAGLNEEGAELPLVEIGWLVAGKLDDVDWQATREARDRVAAKLADSFPQFDWKMPIVRWDELSVGPRVEPAILLDYAVTERNARHWDFIVIVSAAELIGHYRAQPVAVVSRSLDALVISTALLDPRATDPYVPSEQRKSAIIGWLTRLVLYSFGRLCGLPRTNEDQANLLFLPTELPDGAEPGGFSALQQEQLGSELEEIADRRLEETAAYQRVRPWRFYALGAWVNRREIALAVWEARPWQFPFRLSRLTTAALSAMLVLLLTAEVWDLAINQGAGPILLLSFVTVSTATTYVMLRQGLYVRRGKSRLTEQSVTTNITMALVVLLGMVTSYFLVFTTTFLLAALLFHPGVVTGWSGAAAVPLWDEYLLLAGFVAALAMFIGALGATFESSYYFRHITFVDEEV
jgi:hypothetical protein